MVADFPTEPALRDLVARWRSEAALLRRRGCGAPADLAEALAAELEDTLATRDSEPLTLRNAAAESGYSIGHLRRLIASRVLENQGKPRDPRIRRGDLPRKPCSSRVGPDLAWAVLHLPGATGVALRRARRGTADT
jgi:hypothetical protein